jgi:archaellum biogenesis ATPase FlaH
VSVERDLISRLLTDRELVEVTDSGVTPAFFQSSEHREAFKAIISHHREYGVVPTLEAFHRDFPTYRVAEADEPLRYYLDEIVADYRAFLIEDFLVKATDQFDNGEIEESAMTLAQCVMQVNMEISKASTIDMTETGDQRLARYKEYALHNGALKGISTGFSMIDAATGGMQPGQLFTFVGPPKAGKSTMLLLSAMFANMGFYRPLFIGFEMSNEEQEERHDAIRAGVSHNDLQQGRLSGDDFRKLEKMTRRMSLMPAMYFTADPSSTSTLSGISGLIDKYKPDVVYIDGVYMMQDENGEPPGSPQALTNITRALKRLAQSKKVPVAISTQVLYQKMSRKHGVTTQSIGYSSSFGQDSDVLVGVENTDDDVISKVKILDGRNVRKLEFYVKWDWDHGVFEELEPGEEEMDDAEAENRF